MEKAIVLAAAACCCTAASSVCQRMGAKSSPASGFAIGLVFRLARRPVWLLGIAFMIAGFVFQLAALRFGALALVQPILAAELVFVFGYLAVVGSGRVKRRDWLAAAAMSAGIGVFLRVASPSGGRLHAPGSTWLARPGHPRRRAARPGRGLRAGSPSGRIRHSPGRRTGSRHRDLVGVHGRGHQGAQLAP